ncbi:MAG: hypothetical protein NPIRA05_02850 [Nitrospirales bacterium]|nr:MAG: hypothetical protein NPIRA05_02850 [Nitrospirales bacterium]
MIENRRGRALSRTGVAIFFVYVSSMLFLGCSSDVPSVPSSHGSPPIPSLSPERSWIIAPPLKGEEYGDWYFLRARVSSHTILFYQLCLRDRRSGDDGWAFYEKTVDETHREYPTVVLNRKINQKAVMKELIGIMLTREDLEKAERQELILHVKGEFDTMRIRIQSAYARGFLALVDEYVDESS